jgi:Tol biopolymer transport system component
MKRIRTAFLLAILVSSCAKSGNEKHSNPTPYITQITEKNPIVLSFTVMQGGSTPQGSVTRIGFIEQDCLVDIQACPANIMVLPNSIAKDMAPNITWSPDGRKVIFVSDLPGNQDVYIENIDGSDRTNITQSPDREECPAWSPDGGHILFTRETTNIQNSQDQLWITKPDGNGAQIITEGYCASWSPDGSKILFVRQNAGNNNSGSVTSVLYIMQISGFLNGGTREEPIPLTDGSTLVSDPVYSPDGKKIAYLEDENDFSVLKVMNADGKNIVAFNEIEGGVGYPAWSPDSSRLAFIVNKTHTSPADIYIISMEKRAVTQVTESPELSSNGDPSWSPDGTMLVFFSTMISGHFDILIYNVAEKRILRLTIASIDNEYYGPSWRPIPR